MEKKQVIDKVKGIIKKAYIELNELSKQVEEEQSNEDKMIKKVNQIAADTTLLKTQLIG